METKAFYEKSLKMKDTGNHRKKQKRSQNRSQNRAYRAGSSASAAKAHRRQAICIQIGLAAVSYTHLAGTEVELDGEEYIIVKQSDILAIVEA